MDRTLTKTDKNKVFEILRLFNLDPAEFRWSEEHSIEHNDQVTYSKLQHRPTAYYFIFNEYSLSFSPGSYTRIQHERSLDAFTRYTFVSQWATRLRKEIDA